MTGTLEHLDPATLLIGENVRDNAALDSPRCSLSCLEAEQLGVDDRLVELGEDGGRRGDPGAGDDRRRRPVSRSTIGIEHQHRIAVAAIEVVDFAHQFRQFLGGPDVTTAHEEPRLLPRLDHHSVADDHRDVAVPHREVAGHQRIRHEGRAQSGLLCCEKCWPRWGSAWSLVYLLLLSGELANICYFFTLAVHMDTRDYSLTWRLTRPLVNRESMMHRESTCSPCRSSP